MPSTIKASCMGYTPGGAQLPTGAVDVGAVSTITVSPVAPVVMDIQLGTTKSKVCSAGARPRRASIAPRSGTERATRCRDITAPTNGRVEIRPLFFGGTVRRSPFMSIRRISTATRARSKVVLCGTDPRKPRRAIWPALRPFGGPISEESNTCGENEEIGRQED